MKAFLMPFITNLHADIVIKRSAKMLLKMVRFRFKSRGKIRLSQGLFL